MDYSKASMKTEVKRVVCGFRSVRAVYTYFGKPLKPLVSVTLLFSTCNCPKYLASLVHSFIKS